MCRRNQNGIRPVGRLIHIMRLATFFSGRIIVHAVQSVILTAGDGQRVGYIFILSIQKGGPFDQCWMTDSVLRFKVDTV